MLNPAATWSTGSKEQLEKFVKHTAPTEIYSVNSVFDTEDAAVVRDYVVNTLVSGSVEIDAQGRKNIVWLASERTGVTFYGSNVVAETDAVKVVLHHDAFKIHPYPTGSGEFATAKCAKCGAAVVPE